MGSPVKSTPAKKTPVKKDSSSDDSDSSDDEKTVSKTPVKSTPAKKAPVKKDSSSDDSSSDEETTSKPLVKSTPTPAKKSESGNDSSDSSSDEGEKPKPQQSSGNKRKAESSSSDSSDSDDEPNTKKAKMVTSTPAPIKNLVHTPLVESGGSKPASDSGIEDDVKAKFAEKKRSNTPFRRVVAETIEVNPNLTDNSANTSFDTWGAKATADLIVTRGKSFRHEKTKKKRGSYKGGAINTGVASFKFDD